MPIKHIGVKLSFSVQFTAIYVLLFKKIKWPIIIFEGDNSFSIASNVEAKYVYINAGIGNENISDNYFDLKAGEKKILSFSDRYFSLSLKDSMNVTTLFYIFRDH